VESPYAVIESDRTFAVATDEAFVGLITRARNHLVVIAPALTQAVADALAPRFDDIGNLVVTAILYADPAASSRQPHGAVIPQDKLT
jgi:hypothetical protein